MIAARTASDFARSIAATLEGAALVRSIANGGATRRDIERTDELATRAAHFLEMALDQSW
jgi:hypothetical protein